MQDALTLERQRSPFAQDKRYRALRDLRQETVLPSAVPEVALALESSTDVIDQQDKLEKVVTQALTHCSESRRIAQALQDRIRSSGFAKSGPRQAHVGPSGSDV